MKNRLVLKFPQSLIEKPILTGLIKEYDLTLNILKADINPNSEGFVIMEISGDDEKYKKALEYLKGINVEIQPLTKDIVRNDELCTQCSACVGHCPSGALFIKDSKTMEVGFDPEKCVACEACIPVCAYKAMSFKV